MRNAFHVRSFVTGLSICVTVGIVTAQGGDAPRDASVLSNMVTEVAVSGEQLTQRDESNQRRRGGRFWSRWWRGSTENQKNNVKVKSAYKESAESAAESTGRILADGKAVALATVVDADGYLVTKASLLHKDKKLTCRLPGSEPVDVALVGVDDDYDLALLKVDGLKLTPVTWRVEVADPGTFVAAVDHDGSVISIGVISTGPRRVRGTRKPNPRRAWLGVSLGGGEAGTGITGVLNGNAAQRAGLKNGDRIKGIDGNEMKSMEQIIATIGNHAPGDKLAILVQRGGEMLELTATLGKPPHDASPRDQWGGGPFSARREDFPEVITHDTIIRPSQCGGPLIDTDGKAVGVNIARALRVTTYAVTADTVRRLVKELKKS